MCVYVCKPMEYFWRILWPEGYGHYLEKNCNGSATKTNNIPQLIFQKQLNQQRLAPVSHQTRSNINKSNFCESIFQFVLAHFS